MIKERSSTESQLEHEKTEVRSRVLLMIEKFIQDAARLKEVYANIRAYGNLLGSIRDEEDLNRLLVEVSKVGISKGLSLSAKIRDVLSKWGEISNGLGLAMAEFTQQKNGFAPLIYEQVRSQSPIKSTSGDIIIPLDNIKNLGIRAGHKLGNDYLRRIFELDFQIIQKEEKIGSKADITILREIRDIISNFEKPMQAAAEELDELSKPETIFQILGL